jgi:excisionase family DNA binding protein
MSATPAAKEPTDPLLTIDEAANYLAIPKATLYTWRTRRAGFGPRAIKMGGCLRFRRSDLDDWILAHQEAVVASPTPHEGVPAGKALQPAGHAPSDAEIQTDSVRGRSRDPRAGVAMTRRRRS